MLILDHENTPIDRVPPRIWVRREVQRSTHILRVLGRPVAYTPHTRRAYFAWLLVLSYRPGQEISVHQYSPAHARVLLLGRYELGLVLGDWLLGLRLGQPLLWIKRLGATP